MSARRLRVVVTAGPTREHLDPVRYLSNESSGRMGFAIAAAAAREGHRVCLIAGPVTLETPAGVERVDVISAREMLAALKGATEGSDALFMSAAVADYRPRRKRRGKWKVKESGSKTTELELVRNPDLLASVTRSKGARLVVAFALETSDGARRARAKMRAKGADYIVLNGPKALNGERTSVVVYSRAGEVFRCEDRPKREVARKLVALLP